jgi:hypothetical protein
MSPKDSDTVAAIRKFLLATVIIALIGTEVELLLLAHVTPLLQLLPVFLIAVALVSLIWYAVARNGDSLRLFQGTMVACIASGLIGVVVHLAFSAAAETKKDPSLSGMKLIRITLTGQAPPLAPAVMIQIGLVGLAYTFRHPLLSKPAEGDNPRP